MFLLRWQKKLGSPRQVLGSPAHTFLLLTAQHASLELFERSGGVTLFLARSPNALEKGGALSSPTPPTRTRLMAHIGEKKGCQNDAK